MISGDCLIVETADGSFDLLKLLPNGVCRFIYRGIVDPQIARRLAVAKLVPDGHDVYFKDESEPDSAIRPLVI